MSARANIELYDRREAMTPTGTAIDGSRGVLLYHHGDGYPSWMGPELDWLLQEAKAYLNRVGCSSWWDGERVGALMVLFSRGSGSSFSGVPALQPCLELHGDIEYLWRVYLGPEHGAYEIECFRVSWDPTWDHFERFEQVDWRAEAGAGIRLGSDRCA